MDSARDLRRRRKTREEALRPWLIFSTTTYVVVIIALLVERCYKLPIGLGNIPDRQRIWCIVRQGSGALWRWCSIRMDELLATFSCYYP